MGEVRGEKNRTQILVKIGKPMKTVLGRPKGKNSFSKRSRASISQINKPAQIEIQPKKIFFRIGCLKKVNGL